MQKQVEHKFNNDKSLCKVKENCHYAGKYRGVTHSICNSKYSLPK